MRTLAFFLAITCLYAEEPLRIAVFKADATLEKVLMEAMRRLLE